MIGILQVEYLHIYVTVIKMVSFYDGAIIKDGKMKNKIN